MYRWGFEQLRPWLGHRTPMPVGRLICVIDGPSRGRPWSADAAPSFATRGGGRHRAALRAPPAAPRHAVELAHEGVPLDVIRRRLGHTNLGVTSVYLPGIDDAGIIAA
jgi:hypothetical protein